MTIKGYLLMLELQWLFAVKLCLKEKIDVISTCSRLSYVYLFETEDRKKKAPSASSVWI